MQKNLLRTSIKQKLAELSQEEIFLKSKLILNKIIEGIDINNQNTFLIFVSIQKEFRTEKLIDFLLENKKKVLIPKVINESDMIVVDISTNQEFIGPIDIAYIPGIVFGFDCNRIGRGKGYYDRFLAKNHIKYKIGIGFDIQIVEYIPADSHDQKMDSIITESYFIKK